MLRLSIVLIVSVLPLLISSFTFAAERFVSKHRLPSEQTVVVAEGDFEDQSIGSFSVRLYEQGAAADESSIFSSGLIQKRDGAIEKVLLEDLDGDLKPEVLVIARSMGCGNYHSVYVFSTQTGAVSFEYSLDCLSPDFELLQTLK